MTIDLATGLSRTTAQLAAEDRPRLQHAPNHNSRWGLVQLVNLSDDDQLLAWITGTAR